ncbi:hydroxymethylglutaryl-CoA lyase [Aspergillus mulundensis]|uniref:hydroxymethylglutaryl-CoA lyase n=1 Tax=Aspergillus mulundensis TaxID=1810919 RepID=A0A3D8QHE7_9EURO|nr:hypothetical protein DSM5745_10697 [Aspergillus mulundensis]RDW61199.1 hypothetical protein DSM5745_10697 [Aspergillus mulundensis]
MKEPSPIPISQKTARDKVQVRIVEVSPRDGLQNIPSFIPTQTKIELIRRLAETGLQTIEIASVVSPRAVPQLRDWRGILGDGRIKALLGAGDGDGDGGIESDSASASSGSTISSYDSDFNSDPETETETENESGSEGKSKKELTLPILLPNPKGLTLALTHTPSLNAISLFISPTEPFSKTNTNCSVSEALTRASAITHAARKAGVEHLRAYISCIFSDPITHCPTPLRSVLHCTQHLLSLGIDEIALSDTDGSGSPGLTTSLLSYLTSHGIPVGKLACHFHDTRGAAVQNVWAAFEAGVRVFDGSVGGLGGCPFAPGAKGNVDTCALVRLFEGRGIGTGVDGEMLAEVGGWVRGVLGGYMDGDSDGNEESGCVAGKEGEDGEGKSTAQESDEKHGDMTTTTIGRRTMHVATLTTARTGGHCWAFSRSLGIEG